MVRLARAIANLGHTVVRFDWHGVGDSSGEIDRFVLDRPFVGDVVAVCRPAERGHRPPAGSRCLLRRTVGAGSGAGVGEPGWAGAGLLSLPRRADQGRLEGPQDGMAGRGQRRDQSRAVAACGEVGHTAAAASAGRPQGPSHHPHSRLVPGGHGRAAPARGHRRSRLRCRRPRTRLVRDAPPGTARATTWSAPGPGSRSQSPSGAI